MSLAAFGWATFAALSALVGGAVLCLYLLRRTPRVALVSSVALWRRAAQSSRPRVLRASRVPWVAFLVSLLVALLLLLLVADPRFGRGVRGVTVVVVSAGRTMATREGARRRIDVARHEVERWVDRATLGGRVAVVRAGLRPATLLPLTDDPADLRRALAAAPWTVDDGPADLAAALDLADRIVTVSGEAGQILVVADRTEAHPTRAPQVSVPVGAPADTVAITALAARRAPGAAGEYEVRVAVRSFCATPAAARLRVLDGAVPILDRRVRLAPGEQVVSTGRGFSSARAELTARLTEIAVEGSRDALALDDRAYASVPPLSALRVALLSPGSPPLEAALAVHPAVRVTRAASASDLAGADVVVLDRTDLPEGARPRAVVAFRPPAAPIRPAGTVRRPRLSAVLGSHPILAGLRLSGTRIGEADHYRPEPGDEVLLRSGPHALALARASPGQRLVAIGLALDATDLVDREAFPLLVDRALRWAARGPAEPPLPRHLGAALSRAGSLAPPDGPLLGPEGEVLTATDAAAVRHQGLYHVGEQAVAFSAAEHAGPVRDVASGGRLRRSGPLPPLGLFVAGLLLALVLVEWALIHRGRLA
ncbi:MAG: VWA domain-containing protein [Sandaracinaceae bacterium]